MVGFLYDLFIRPLNVFIFSDLRSELVAQARGRTLEIGVGTGFNLEFYPKQGVELTAIEPDESVRLRAVKRNTKNLGKIINGDVEKLEFPDQVFDTVVSTLVFCSVENPQKGLREVFRVLKSGGQFLIFEHVRRNTPVVGWVLDHLNPAWLKITGGCNLNRDPQKIMEDIGFKAKQFRPLWHGLGKIWILEKP